MLNKIFLWILVKIFASNILAQFITMEFGEKLRFIMAILPEYTDNDENLELVLTL